MTPGLPLACAEVLRSLRNLRVQTAQSTTALTVITRATWKNKMANVPYSEARNDNIIIQSNLTLVLFQDQLWRDSQEENEAPMDLPMCNNDPELKENIKLKVYEIWMRV